MPTAYAYSRVSPRDTDTANSHLVQEERAKAYFEYAISMDDKSVVWGGIVQDDQESAFKRDFKNRPGGSQLCSVLQPGDHLIFLRMDRAFRRLKDFAQQVDDWNKAGIHVHFVDHRIDLRTAAGRAFAQFLAIFAEWQSAITSERVRDVKAIQKARREVTNQHPGYGYRRQLVTDGPSRGRWIKVQDKRQRGAMQEIVRLRETCPNPPCSYRQPSGPDKLYTERWRCPRCGTKCMTWLRISRELSRIVSQFLGRQWRDSYWHKQLYARNQVAKIYRAEKAFQAEEQAAIRNENGR